MNLGLLQLSDSALPISGYTHSWGLETAITSRTVHDPESLERWTRIWLRTSLGPFEGVVVAAACRSAESDSISELVELNRLVDASIAPPSIRTASREMGRQLLALGSTWHWSERRLGRLLQSNDWESEPWHHAVAFGLLGQFAGGDVHEVLASFLHQAVLGMIGAGVRAIPVGHTHGQQILAYLHEEIARLVPELIRRAPVSAGAGCPQYEILCDEQTRLYARMYRS
ncbi:MAG: urease accessory UreF family protein [Isosphaeraceae bacterium]|nr:urease accessory UreF family protein [Isosphaeraceae bacterium]